MTENTDDHKDIHTKVPLWDVSGPHEAMTIVGA